MKENIELAIKNCLRDIEDMVSVQDTLTDLIISLISDDIVNIDLGKSIPIRFCGNIFEIRYIEVFTSYDNNDIASYEIVLSLDKELNKFDLEEIDEVSFYDIANAVIDYAIDYLCECNIQDRVGYY